MQMIIETEHDKRLISTTISGHFDYGEFTREHLLRAQNVELAGYSLLLDLRQAEVGNLSSANSKAYGAIVHLPKPPNLAILVNNDEQRRFAAAFIAGRYLNGIYSPCRLFDQLEEALDWIKEQG
ncbi:MAG: hypothetical protein ACI81O_001775 [Cyclobacteriaceae bacterium]|jgi:hypothetical protein